MMLDHETSTRSGFENITISKNGAFYHIATKAASKIVLTSYHESAPKYFDTYEDQKSTQELSAYRNVHNRQPSRLGHVKHGTIVDLIYLLFPSVLNTRI
jgi:hypothetical protein